MGGSLSKALAKIFGNKEMRILMLGLDAAGKTSILFIGLKRKFETYLDSLFFFMSPNEFIFNPLVSLTLNAFISRFTSNCNIYL